MALCSFFGVQGIGTNDITKNGFLSDLKTQKGRNPNDEFFLQLAHE